MILPTGWKEWALVLGIVVFAIGGNFLIHAFVPERFAVVVLGTFIVAFGMSIWRERRQRGKSGRHRA